MGVKSSGHSRARLVRSKACMRARIRSGFFRTLCTSPSSNRPEESRHCRAAASAAGSITNPGSVTATRRTARCQRGRDSATCRPAGLPVGQRFSVLIGLVLLVRCRPVPCHLERRHDVANGAGI